MYTEGMESAGGAGWPQSPPSSAPPYSLAPAHTRRRRAASTSTSRTSRARAARRIPARDKPKKDTIKPSVETQIEEQGGSDAPVLTEVATSSDYGAGPKLPAAPKMTVREGEISQAAPEADVSNGAVAASAVSAVSGAETARLVGFLLVLFGITVATLTAAALRQRPRTTRSRPPPRYSEAEKEGFEPSREACAPLTP